MKHDKRKLLAACMAAAVAGWSLPDPGATREPVELVPFGATCLRTTCFPTGKN